MIDVPTRSPIRLFHSIQTSFIYASELVPPLSEVLLDLSPGSSGYPGQLEDLGFGRGRVLEVELTQDGQLFLVRIAGRGRNRALAILVR
jgi:hypothetical protein